MVTTNAYIFQENIFNAKLIYSCYFIIAKSQHELIQKVNQKFYTIIKVCQKNKIMYDLSC